jgi:RNA polymerase subunit RPABC4/transcription elongation factor Spt4
MTWSCEHCGTILRLWKVRCPNCRKTAMSWLQLAVIVGLAVPALFLLLKLI